LAIRSAAAYGLVDYGIFITTVIAVILWPYAGRKLATEPVKDGHKVGISLCLSSEEMASRRPFRCIHALFPVVAIIEIMHHGEWQLWTSGVRNNSRYSDFAFNIASKSNNQISFTPHEFRANF